jgi:hypothetical protein
MSCDVLCSILQEVTQGVKQDLLQNIQFHISPAEQMFNCGFSLGKLSNTWACQGAKIWATMGLLFFCIKLG